MDLKSARAPSTATRPAWAADQQRLREIGEQTKRLVQSLKDNQDVEATEVANALLLDALTRRIATAEEEFDALPLDKAGGCWYPCSAPRCTRPEPWRTSAGW